MLRCTCSQNGGQFEVHIAQILLLVWCIRHPLARSLQFAFVPCPVPSRLLAASIYQQDGHELTASPDLETVLPVSLFTQTLCATQHEQEPLDKQCVNCFWKSCKSTERILGRTDSYDKT